MIELICAKCQGRFGITELATASKFYCPYCGHLDSVADDD